jgi:hypothetical protein
MPLAIPSGGDASPYIRFGAAINAWQMSDTDGRAIEFEFNQPAVFDIQNVQLGWLLLETGNRDWKPWPGNAQQPKPEGEYKAGFDIKVYSKQLFGDEPLRSYSSNSTGNVMFMQDLYNQAETAAEFAQGMSPVVQITGSKALKVGKGNTRVPQFQIVKWVARPVAFDSGQEAATAKPAPAKPAAKPAPAATSDEF